uniref:Uncharacterized protein n=1 Tax=Avena sativa TaxID=4498 RepID=A0ACD5XBJ2_AVESA
MLQLRSMKNRGRSLSPPPSPAKRRRGPPLPPPAKKKKKEPKAKGPNAIRMEELWDKFVKDSSTHCLVWLKQFRTFEDKSSAINHNTGINERLSEMIMKCYRNAPPGMKLAVAKPEYKKTIEERLNIPCVHGPIVMELMWGLQNCMESLVPSEKSRLTKEDLLPVSQGLQTVLSRYGYNDVKPEMLIVKMASALFWADSIEKRHSEPTRNVGDLILAVSGINCQDWSLLKIVTALKAIWLPEEIGDSWETISDDDVSRLVKDRRKYEALIDKWGCLRVYHDISSAHDARTMNKRQLEFFVMEAKKAYEAKQVVQSA